VCLLFASAAYKLNVHVNEADKNKPLQISHFPQILGSESTKVAHTITVIVSMHFTLIRYGQPALPWHVLLSFSWYGKPANVMGFTSCQGSDGEKRVNEKMFITGFTFGASPVYSRLLQAAFCRLFQGFCCFFELLQTF